MIKNDIEKLLRDKMIPGHIAEEVAIELANTISNMVRDCRTRTVSVPCPYCMHNTNMSVLIGHTNVATGTINCQSCNRLLSVTVQSETTVTRIVPKDDRPRPEQLTLNF